MNPTTSKRQRSANLIEKPGVSRASKRICLPVDSEVYQELVSDQAAYRSYHDECIRRYPELFPANIGKGYKLNGFCEQSVKMPVRIRRICLHECSEGGSLQVFQLVPSFVLPYMTGEVAAVEKAMFLHYKFGVPFWALSYVFGRNDSYWYRLSQHLGRASLVGTSVKQANKLPEHVLADEKHTHIDSALHQRWQQHEQVRLRAGYSVRLYQVDNTHTTTGCQPPRRVVGLRLETRLRR